MANNKPLQSSQPTTMKTYTSFAAWEDDQMGTNQLTSVVSQYVDSVAPHLEKIVKWGQGCYLKQGTPVIYIHTEADHIQLGFFNGSTLSDPNKFLEGKGKYVRHVKIVGADDIDNKNVHQYIKQVI